MAGKHPIKMTVYPLNRTHFELSFTFKLVHTKCVSVSDSGFEGVLV